MQTFPLEELATSIEQRILAHEQRLGVPHVEVSYEPGTTPRQTRVNRLKALNARQDELAVLADAFMAKIPAAAIEQARTELAAEVAALQESNQ